MSRRWPGQRAARIIARTLHLAAVAMVVGAAVFGGEPGVWVALLVASGGFIIGDELYKYGTDWFRFASAWAMGAKLLLLCIGGIWPDALVPCLFGALIVGSVISHAPGNLRHAALWGTDGPCARNRTPNDPVTG